MLTALKFVRPAQIAVRQVLPVGGVAGARFMATKTEELSYSEKQALKGRFVSPHVQIYKFPVVALSSITNRVTGVILTGGLTAIAGMAHVQGLDVANLLSSIGDIAVVGNVAKFSVAFPLIFHYLGGVRHLVWDRNPQMLTNEQVESSSKILFGVSTAAAIALAVI